MSNVGTCAGIRRVARGASLTLALAVDDHVADVLQQLGGAIAAGRELEQLGRLVDEPRRAVAGEERRVVDQADQKRNVRLHAANAELLQAALRPAGRLAEGAAPGGHLHQQRVVERRHDGAGEGGAAVEPNAHAARRTVVREPAVVGHELVRRVFGRHAALNRKAVRRDLILRRQADLRPVEPFALRNENLRSHDVDAGHFFGDGVLDLDPRIDLDEVQLVRVRIDEELDRAGVVVAHRASDRERGITDLLTDVARQVRRGGDFDHLLMPPLHRAVALPKVNQVAVAVAEQLDFDVPRPRDELLDEDLVAAESVERFATSSLKGVGKILRLLDNAHAAAAAAVGRLEDHGELECFGGLQTFFDRSAIGESLPPRTGTPTCFATARAAILSPSFSSSSVRGPTKVMPAARQARAKSGFSDRKP